MSARGRTGSGLATTSSSGSSYSLVPLSSGGPQDTLGDSLEVGAAPPTHKSKCACVNETLPIHVCICYTLTALPLNFLHVPAVRGLHRRGVPARSGRGGWGVDRRPLEGHGPSGACPLTEHAPSCSWPGQPRPRRPAQPSLNARRIAGAVVRPARAAALHGHSGGCRHRQWSWHRHA